MNGPLVLMILDGFGLSDEYRGNAIRCADTKCIDRIFAEHPITSLGASGLSVGLPDGQMGNSEVGHTNIGAGRVVYQELTRISKAIDTGEFYENKKINEAMDNAIQNGTSLHLLGLLSDGGVHSHNTHLYALLKLAKDKGLKQVYIHGILDGRDVPPKSGRLFVDECQGEIDRIGVGVIATVMGRYYAMDRDNRWDRIEKAYNAMVHLEGEHFDSAGEAVDLSYGEGITDEFVVPAIINGAKPVREDDSVIFFNFRPDRAREITAVFVDPDFSMFERHRVFFPVKYITMTQYDTTLPNVEVAFEPQSLKNTFGEYISKCGLSQLRIAETEKYAHVTFFFNAGAETPYVGEERVLVHSPRVATYDLQPEMSAYEVTDRAVDFIGNKKVDVVILNFANCDMVGHTGVFDAAIKAVETVDECVGKVVTATQQVGGVVFITADHGNADKMIDDDGQPFTAHTTNRVPFCSVGYSGKLRSDGGLADIAPTMLEVLGLKKPDEMDGVSLFQIQ